MPSNLHDPKDLAKKVGHGKWTFHPHNNTLTFPKPYYEVDLDTCQNATERDAWGKHLGTKSWINAGDLYDFQSSVHAAWSLKKPHHDNN